MCRIFNYEVYCLKLLCIEKNVIVKDFFNLVDFDMNCNIFNFKKIYLDI